jgi:symplekin
MKLTVVRNALIMTATLNGLGVLARSRPAIVNKVLTAILSFNPLKRANSPMTPLIRMQVRSTEKTTRALLLSINKRLIEIVKETRKDNPWIGKIQQHVERLAQSRHDIFDEASRKRGYAAEPMMEGVDSNKRARMHGLTPVSTPPQGQVTVPPLPTGPVSVKDLFTVTQDVAMKGFDVTGVPHDLAHKVVAAIIYQLDGNKLTQTIEGIKARLIPIERAQAMAAAEQAQRQLQGVDDDDEYDPDFEPAEDSEQILNRLDAEGVDELKRPEPVMALGPFTLEQPPPFTQEEKATVSQEMVGRVFGTMSILDEPSATKKQKTGINRVAASSYDRSAWITVITRLATRASMGLDADKENIKSEELVSRSNEFTTLSDAIRQGLFMYILEDFRPRIGIAITWLNEEWYNDRIAAKVSSPKHTTESSVSQYDKWSLRVLDGILPYLGAGDMKVLTRFLSEIPWVGMDILLRVKSLCVDPEKVSLAVTSLQYLIMLRPPAREWCLDVLEDLWRNCESFYFWTERMHANLGR